MKKVLKWISVLLVISLCSSILYAVVWIRQYQAMAVEEPAIVLSPDIVDLTYCIINGTPLKLDLYFPNRTIPPYPLLVYVHGGSFTAGDKRKGSGIIDIPAMTARGYAVAALNYRLMPENPFPAEVIDAKCAIRYLRAHAAEHQLNTERIGIWGGSAGGYLAVMVGLTNGDTAFDAGDYLDQSSHVEAVAEMFGPTDLTAPFGWLQRWLMYRAFGTDDSTDPLLVRASPVNNITDNAPPLLILHGEQDDAVPVEQAQMLYLRLKEEGNDATLMLVKNANHNFKPTGGAIEPSRAEISKIMGDFFDLWLK